MASTCPPIEYMRLELDDGHLFICNQEVAHRFSGTLRTMIDEQAVLDAISNEKKMISVKISDHGTAAIEVVLNFIHWRHCYSDAPLAETPNWPIPKGNPALIQAMTRTASYLKI